jgi:hypothetical protein
MPSLRATDDDSLRLGTLPDRGVSMIRALPPPTRALGAARMQQNPATPNTTERP